MLFIALSLLDGVIVTESFIVASDPGPYANISCADNNYYYSLGDCNFYSASGPCDYIVVNCFNSML